MDARMLSCRDSDYTECFSSWIPWHPLTCIKIFNTSWMCDHFLPLLSQVICFDTSLLLSSPPHPHTNLPDNFIPLFLLSMHCPYCSFPSIFCGLSNEGLTNNPIHAFDNTSDSPREDDVLTRVDRYLLMAYVDVMEHIACVTLHCLPSILPLHDQMNYFWFHLFPLFSHPNQSFNYSTICCWHFERLFCDVLLL